MKNDRSCSNIVNDVRLRARILTCSLMQPLVQDEGMMELAERCGRLRYLCISNCSHLTDQTLISLAAHCPDLVTLECAGLSQLTDAGFQVSMVPGYPLGLVPGSLVG